MSEYLAFKWKMVWFGLVWFGLVWFGFSYFGSLSLVKFGTMQNLKSIGRELIEILRFINAVALVQFWLTFFFFRHKSQIENTAKLCLGSVENCRIRNMIEKLMAFNFKCNHIRGVENKIADCLSRLTRRICET